MEHQSAISYKGVKSVLFAFIAFSVISYLYVLFTGTYNGDYLRVAPELSQWELFLNLLYTIAPFFVLFWIYKHYRTAHSKYRITIPVKALGQFLVIILIFQITVTALYGVGKMGAGIYNAPPIIKIFIQILNRLNPIFGTFLYIIVSGKRNKSQILLIVLLLLLSILRASLGIFVFLGLFLLLRYHEEIIRFIKKRLLVVILVATLSPVIVGVLYDYRNGLRGIAGSVKTLKSYELVLGTLVGRMSSYANSAIVLERKKTMTQLAGNFPLMQYPKGALAAFYGKIVDRNNITYSSIMLESDGNHTRTSSFMAGSQGALIIGLYQSVPVFFVNLLTMLMIVAFSFRLTSLLHYEEIKDMMLLFFCFNMLSGAADEFMANLMNLLLYLLLFLILNCFRKR